MKSILLILLSVSPYINKVYEYKPAPGQFINTAISNPESIIGEESSMLCLGAYGGYVVFGFDHRVMNVADKPDLRIIGNAFVNNCEPAVVLVSKDENENGLPDDTWYEIAGAAEDSAATVFGYEITYYKPDDLNEDIKWQDNLGESGYVYRNAYHKQAYWPEAVTEPTLMFTGTRLPNMAVNTSAEGEQPYWILPGLEYGYADNLTDSIDLDWAVEIESREPVSIDGIDFVKVYTAVNQSAGWVGETSTEIAGAEDLNMVTSLQGRFAEWSLPLQDHFAARKKISMNGQMVIEYNEQRYTILGIIIN